MSWKKLFSCFRRLHPRAFDPMKIYSFSYWFYVLTGFWKYESSVRWKTNLYRVYQVVIALCYGASISFFIVDAIVVRNDFEKLAFNLSNSFLVFVTLSKVSLLVTRKEGLEILHQNLENHLHVSTIGKSEEDKEIFRKRAEQLVHVSRLFYGLLFVAYPLRIIADTALGSRSYLIPMPFKEELDQHYEILYCQQVVVISHFLVTVICHDMLVYAVILRFIAHFEVLEKNILLIKSMYPKRDFQRHVAGYLGLDDLTETEKDVLIKRTNYSEKVKKKEMAAYLEDAELRERKTSQFLRESISHHQILIKEINNFGAIYSLPLMVQACGAGFLIGIVLLQLLLMSSEITLLLVQQILYVLTTSLNILHLCSFASELVTKSCAAADALYETPWYEMNSTNRMLVRFTMKKLIDAPKLKGGGVIVVDRATYLKFLRISYNMVAVLRNFY